MDAGAGAQLQLPGAFSGRRPLHGVPGIDRDAGAAEEVYRQAARRDRHKV